METVREFDLNIEQVLENWETRHALREIIANAFDEQVITNSEEVQIFKDQDGKWHVRDFGRGLEYRHFTQNENPEKLTMPGLIGKFGVGLKDALATFDRHGIKIEIESKHGVFRIKHSKKAGFDDIVTLHAEVSPPRQKDFVGTDFTIDGCSDDDMDAAKEFFLVFAPVSLVEETKYGSIYKKTGDVATIYINGIKVAEEPNFLYSYNITSLTTELRKALNRERTNVGRNAYTSRVKDILLSAKLESTCKMVLDELKMMNSGEQKDELKWLDVQMRFIEILNRKANVVFVTSSEFQNLSGREREIIEDSGKEIVYIPENAMSKIKSDDNSNITTTGTVFKDYRDSFQYKFVAIKNLTRSERRVFDYSRKVIEKVFPDFDMRKLHISETLIPDEYSTRGVYESLQDRIIILREVLGDFQEYLGVLAHELIHAKSGESDCSREFENALTSYIGELLSELM